MPDTMITIMKCEHKRLIANENFLSVLMAAGVENWEGYDEAVAIYEEKEGILCPTKITSKSLGPAKSWSARKAMVLIALAGLRKTAAYKTALKEAHGKIHELEKLNKAEGYDYGGF